MALEHGSFPSQLVLSNDIDVSVIRHHENDLQPHQEFKKGWRLTRHQHSFSSNLV